MKKVLVTGGRDYADQARVWDVLDELLPVCEDFMVIQGGATGADSHARAWCEDRGVIYAEVPAEHLWPHLGKAAGPIRNEAMVSLGPDLVLAFPGGKGTDNCVRTARLAGVEVRREC